jgi:uncharacterized protein YjiS (DUF1127 family)
MTTATAARADAGLLTGPERTLGTWTAIKNAWSRHRAYRATIAELGGLTDRLLADIGTNRGDLERAARRGVYGD